MMNSALKIKNFVSNTMNYVLQKMNFAFKMVDFEGARLLRAVHPARAAWDRPGAFNICTITVVVRIVYCLTYVKREDSSIETEDCCLEK